MACSHVSWSHDSRVFATASMDSHIRVVRAHDCHLCAILSDSLSAAPVMECEFTYDCASIVSISEDGVLRCWNVRTALEPVLGQITMLESIEAVVASARKEPLAISRLLTGFSSIQSRLRHPRA